MALPALVRALTAAALAVAALAATAASASAKSGTFAGSIGIPVPKGAQADIRAVDRATGAVGAARSVGRNGRWRPGPIWSSAPW
jgi:hypothetical protein